MTTPTRHPRRERGSASLQAAIIAVPVLLILGLVIAVSVFAKARVTVGAVAFDAARAASISRTASEAQSDGSAAAAASFEQQGLTCTQSSTAIDTSGFSVEPGTPATVSATVTCTVSAEILGINGIAGTRTFTATARSPLDSFRGRS